MKKKICILGLGYIGLPTAAMFATHGHKIVGVDVNNTVVSELNKGKITIEEPYLDIMVQSAVKSGNLVARSTPEDADVFIIAVPTPINKDKTADMSYVVSATESIVPCLKKGNIVILESTSPPGTVENLLIPILEKSGLDVGRDLLVAHSPERVLPGRILKELEENNRIIGGVNQESCEAVKELYRTFVKGEIYLTTPTTAEMTKLMENTFRDVNIALANELAKICESMKINAWEVIELANKHPRVNIHQPGPGVGGHCLAVDPWFIVEKQPKTAKIIDLSRKTNDSMPTHVYDRIKEILSGIKDNKKVTILGVTYKPNIDDLRESPVLELIDLLEQDDDIDISIFDPHVFTCKYIEKDMYNALKDSDLAVLAVNHDYFKNVDFQNMKGVMKTPNILDTRNFWSEDIVNDLGLDYYLLGKK
ncbi:nucleotide sugar dehydrogenase [Clostridiisalibacter paucivorans]|uniref:nucleotide sugar dehydrogenase n=1 Tax=Clostridiisalibacter paucivorans TaxID=408753 RepID=UPI00047C0ED3|nr:nucleotide sugar dehydrogenase [Clostridiisalibacter paucivorans]